MTRQLRKKRRVQMRPRYLAKLTSKHQATIPREVRKRLHLKSGDQILYELQADGTIVIRKVQPLDLAYLEALNSTLNEWKTEEDEQAYKNL